MTEKINNSKLTELISGRRTIHQFVPELKPEDKLKEAIDLARWAPNHHLTEPWHFYLLGAESVSDMLKLNIEITRQSKGDEIAEKKARQWFAVPGWFLVTCARSDDPVRSREDYAACCCAVQNLLLALWNESVGVKWTSGEIIRDKKFYDLLWIDHKRETIIGLFCYGYAKETPRVNRKSCIKIITELP